MPVHVANPPSPALVNVPTRCASEPTTSPSKTCFHSCHSISTMSTNRALGRFQNNTSFLCFFSSSHAKEMLLLVDGLIAKSRASSPLFSTPPKNPRIQPERSCLADAVWGRVVLVKFYKTFATFPHYKALLPIPQQRGAETRDTAT